MNIDTKVNYAMNRLKQLAKEELNGVQQINQYNNSISIEFSNGMQFELSDKEIELQAISFLESEIDSIYHS
tara:strand:- start:51 stop:263 length:213 start_codon:yes stop_codon:yes gene_type:complete